MTTVSNVTVTRACIIYKAGIARMTVITKIFMFEPGLVVTYCTATRIQHSSYRQCHCRTQRFINVARSLLLSWYWSSSPNATHKTAFPRVNSGFLLQWGCHVSGWATI